MGTGASKNAMVGVPANPRVVYSDELSRQENKKLCIDAPVLVDMKHGSVRFRKGEGGHQKDQQVREVPYEGTVLDQKEHYFYHTRLNNFGSDADKNQEDAFKFYYVTKGPKRAQGKRLFYVYGQGWNARDSLRVKPTETATEGKDFAWPKKYGPNDMVYALVIVNQTPLVDSDADWEENCMLDDLESTPDKSQLRLKVKSEEQVSSLKARLAVKLLKAAANIHVCHNEVPLRSEDVLGDLRAQEERVPAILDVHLTLL